jgi:hypothetical protein
MPRGKSEYGLSAVAWNLCPFEEPRVAIGGYHCGVHIFKVRDGSLEKVNMDPELFFSIIFICYFFFVFL